MIGRIYKYPLSNRKFKLAEIIDGWLYIFECGHRVTDCVFEDLIDCSTGIQNYLNKQLTLF